MVIEVLYTERPLLSRRHRQPYDQKRTEAWELRLANTMKKCPMLTGYGSHELYSNLFGTCETMIPSTYRVSLRPIALANVLAANGHKCALDVGSAGGII